ncbi:MAG: VWA domain-containing protein, partial [Burkholderiales bacterium]
MGTHMTRFQTGFLFAASALTLAACSSTGSEGGAVQVSQSEGRGSDQVVVTGSKREPTAQDAAIGVTSNAQENFAPPAPPPIGMAAPLTRVAPTYAQVMPQPMPGDVNRDKYADVKINSVKLVADEPVSTFSIDVDTASYSNVRRMLNAGHLPPKDAVRIEELINYFDYDYALPKSKNVPFETTVKVVPSPWAEGRQLMHVAVQGYD